MEGNVKIVLENYGTFRSDCANFNLLAQLEDRLHSEKIK